MLAFRAHVRRASSRWTWEVRQEWVGASSYRSGSAATRADAIRAALRPTPAQVQLPSPQAQAPAPAALAA